MPSLNSIKKSQITPRRIIAHNLISNILYIVLLYIHLLSLSVQTSSTNSQWDASCLFLPPLDIRQCCNSMRFHYFIISDEILVPYSTSTNTQSSKEKKERCEMMFIWVHFNFKGPNVQNSESHHQFEFVLSNNRTNVNWMSCVLPMHLWDNNTMWQSSLKGIVPPKIIILSSFLYHLVVTNMYILLASVEHKEDI